MNRRETLKLLQSGLVLSSTAWAASPVFAAKRDKRPVALLVPLTGPRAALGHSMRNAAMLAESDGNIIAFDTQGTPAGAADAAKDALRKKSALILGPLLSGEVAAVTSTVDRKVPVIAFTNNAAARATGAFVFGITPGQVTSAILSYARSRGVRNVAVIDDGTPWAAAAAAAATPLEGELMMKVRKLKVTPGAPLPDAGDPPDAVLVPGTSDTALAIARNLKGTGVQLLATLEALDHRPDALATLDGAWIASPDPEAFGKFASDFEARNGGDPGAIAALAYDAGSIAKALRASDTLNREGVLRNDGFPGVAGQVRFRTDGSVAREFAILLAGPNGYQKVATSQGA